MASLRQCSIVTLECFDSQQKSWPRSEQNYSCHLPAQQGYLIVMLSFICFISWLCYQCDKCFKTNSSANECDTCFGRGSYSQWQSIEKNRAHEDTNHCISSCWVVKKIHRTTQQLCAKCVLVETKYAYARVALFPIDLHHQCGLLQWESCFRRPRLHASRDRLWIWPADDSVPMESDIAHANTAPDKARPQKKQLTDMQAQSGAFFSNPYAWLGDKLRTAFRMTSVRWLRQTKESHRVGPHCHPVFDVKKEILIIPLYFDDFSFFWSNSSTMLCKHMLNKIASLEMTLIHWRVSFATRYSKANSCRSTTPLWLWSTASVDLSASSFCSFTIRMNDTNLKKLRVRSISKQKHNTLLLYISNIGWI